MLPTPAGDRLLNRIFGSRAERETWAGAQGRLLFPLGEVSQFSLHHVVVSGLEHRIPAGEEKLPFADEFIVVAESPDIIEIHVEALPILVHGAGIVLAEGNLLFAFQASLLGGDDERAHRGKLSAWENILGKEVQN